VAKFGGVPFGDLSVSTLAMTVTVDERYPLNLSRLSAYVRQTVAKCRNLFSLVYSLFRSKHIRAYITMSS